MHHYFFDTSALVKHYLREVGSAWVDALIDVHLECQVVGLPTTLVSADVELNADALAEGLIVDDPNHHP